MPLLGALLQTLFGGLFAFLVRVVGMRLALASAAVAAFAVLTVGMYAAAQAVVSGLSVSFPGSAAALLGVWLVVPDNAAVCLAAIFGTDAAVALYRWNSTVIRLAAG